MKCPEKLKGLRPHERWKWIRRLGNLKCPERVKGLWALFPLFDFYFAEGAKVKAFKGLTEFNFTDQLSANFGFY